MRFISFKPISPINLPTFQTQLIRFFIFQGIGVILGLSLYWIGWNKDNSAFQVVGLFLFAILALIPQRALARAIFGRIHSLYPSLSQWNVRWTLVFCLFPITWLALMLFLTVKDSDKPISQPPFIFRWMKATGAGMLLCILFLWIQPATSILQNKVPTISTPIAYWIANPTTSFLASLSEEVLTLMKLKDQTLNNPNHSNPIEDFLSLEKSHQFTVTGVILMDAVVVMQHIKQKELKQKEMGKELVSPQIYLEMFEDLTAVNEVRKRALPIGLTFNPLTFFSPTSAIEIALISGITLKLESNFEKTFQPKMMEMMQRISLEIQKNNDPAVRENLQKRFNSVQARYKEM